MHPLVTDLSTVKDSEIDIKISELTRIYFNTNNFDVKQQVMMLLDTYKIEQSNRQQAAWQKMMDNRNKDLDKLIKVS